LRIERERVLWGGSGRNFIPKMKRMMGETWCRYRERC
jgi:hypothetical protein